MGKAFFPVTVAVLLLLASCGQKKNTEQSKAMGDTAAHKTTGTAASSSLAQQDAALASQAAAMQASLEEYNNNGSTAKEDSFITTLKKTLASAPSFTYNFPALQKKEIRIVTSDDGTLRLFSWLSPYSGTMLTVQHVFQLKLAGGGVHSFTLDELYKEQEQGNLPTPYFTGIYRLPYTGDTCYILIGEGQMSGSEPYRVVHNLTLSKGVPSFDRKLFNTGRKQESEIYVSITPSPGSGGNEDLTIPVIRYDTAAKEISYPETVERKDHTALTGKTRKIRFNGKVFQ